MVEDITPDLICFDLETTGLDVFEDRIVTASITEMTRDGKVLVNKEWLINPGVEIPEEATATHGITTEYAREHGEDPGEALYYISSTLNKSRAIPLVVMNAQYDASLLNYELERHGDVPVDWSQFNIIDPMILDRTLDKWRKGPRKLVNLAKHYGVEVDESKAHESTYDNYLAGNVAIALVRKYKITNGFLKTQAKLYRDWADGFEEYKQKTDPSFRMESKEWPLRTRVAQPE